MSRPAYVVATAVGFVPHPEVPLEDYDDFLGRGFERRELVSDLRAGVLPPGLALMDDSGLVALVVGRYGARQGLVRFDTSILMEVDDANNFEVRAENVETF